MISFGANNTVSTPNKLIVFNLSFISSLTTVAFVLGGEYVSVFLVLLVLDGVVLLQVLYLGKSS